MKTEEILKILKEGESEKTEFKRTVTPNIGEEICALANTAGGVILIGVDDSGEVFGCDPNDAKKRIAQFAASITPPPKLRFETAQFGRKRILAVRVEKIKTICSLGGLVYIRVGSSKRPLSFHEILSLGVEQLLFQADRITTDVRANEIRRKWVKWFSNERKKRGLKPADEKLLARLGAVVKRNGRAVLSLAGLLFFHPFPQEHLPSSHVRLISGDSWKRFEGPVWKLVDEVYAYLVKQLERVSLFAGARREDFLEYPEKALREALVNAVTHRNYLLGSEIFVYLKPGELKIVNPGGFPPGVTVANPRPVPRNPVLYELMFQAGYVERQGRGITLIIEETKKHPACTVEFSTGPDFTEVTFRKKPVRGLDPIDTKLYSLLKEGKKSSSQLARELGVSKVTILRRIERLRQQKLVRKEGRGSRQVYAAA